MQIINLFDKIPDPQQEMFIKLGLFALATTHAQCVVAMGGGVVTALEAYNSPKTVHWYVLKLMGAQNVPISNIWKRQFEFEQAGFKNIEFRDVPHHE